MFEEAKTQPVTETTLALGAPSTVPSPFEEAKTAELVSTIGESEVASTVPIGPEIGIETLPGGIDIGKIGPVPQLPSVFVTGSESEEYLGPLLSILMFVPAHSHHPQRPGHEESDINGPRHGNVLFFRHL